eukprot:8453900-Alexandrium_andersonii.AAC.1
MAMIRRLRRLHECWRRGRIHMLPDSDVRAQCAKALQCRGWQSVTATWIKSHQDPGEAGCPLDEWTRANGHADGYAKRATHSRHGGIDRVMHGLCARRAEYSAFVQEAHAIMLRVLKASAGIGVAKAKLEQGQPR